MQDTALVVFRCIIDTAVVNKLRKIHDNVLSIMGTIAAWVKHARIQENSKAVTGFILWMRLANEGWRYILWRHLSLAGCIHKMIPTVITGIGGYWCYSFLSSGIILWMRPANERSTLQCIYGLSLAGCMHKMIPVSPICLRALAQSAGTHLHVYRQLPTRWSLGRNLLVLCMEISA